jgi:hypothetical protein
MPTQIGFSLINVQNPINILVNGGFEVWQRGVGPFTTDGLYTADMWKLTVGSGATIQISKESTEIYSGIYSLKMNRTVVGSASSWVQQVVENYKDYIGKTVSVSVMVKTSVASTFKLGLTDGVTDTESSFHTGGGGWEKLTITKTISLSATQIRLRVYALAGGSTGIVYVDNAMLVLGSKPVDFTPLQPADDFERCQRYYEEGRYYLEGRGRDHDSAYVCGGASRFNTRKASAPTITVSTWIIREEGSATDVQASYGKYTGNYGLGQLYTAASKAAGGSLPSYCQADWIAEVT